MLTNPEILRKSRTFYRICVAVLTYGYLSIFIRVSLGAVRENREPNITVYAYLHRFHISWHIRTPLSQPLDLSFRQAPAAEMFTCVGGPFWLRAPQIQLKYLTTYSNQRKVNRSATCLRRKIEVFVSASTYGHYHRSEQCDAIEQRYI